MSEFCLDCWNSLNDTCFKKEEVLLSGQPERCEHCGLIRPVVIRMRRRSRLKHLYWHFKSLLGR